MRACCRRRGLPHGCRTHACMQPERQCAMQEGRTSNTASWGASCSTASNLNWYDCGPADLSLGSPARPGSTTVRTCRSSVHGLGRRCGCWCCAITARRVPRDNARCADATWRASALPAAAGLCRAHAPPPPPHLGALIDAQRIAREPLRRPRAQHDARRRLDHGASATVTASRSASASFVLHTCRSVLRSANNAPRVVVVCSCLE